MASGSRSAPGTVGLVGPSPRNLHRSALGIYIARAELVNGYPSYTLNGSRDTALWHAGRVWLVGLTSEIGEAKGWLKAADGAQRPDLVAAQWEVYDGGAMACLPAPELRCISDEALQSALASAPGTVSFVGPMPGNLKQDRLGIFTKRAELVNGWPSYALTRSSDVALWHAGEGWYVGVMSDIGKARGTVSAADGALRPDLVVAPWQAADGTSTWQPVPELRCISDEALQSALATLAPVGPTLPTEPRPERPRPDGSAESIATAKVTSDQVKAHSLPAPSLVSAGSDKRVEALLQPSPEDLVDGKSEIDKAALERRTSLARDRLSSISWPQGRAPWVRLPEPVRRISTWAPAP